MKKHLIVIGMTLVLLTVGLSGCEDIGIGITNIGDITANPENYYGKEVTIEGTCTIGFISDDKGHTMAYKYDSYLTGLYRVTGTIVEENTGISYYYIEIKQAKALQIVDIESGGRINPVFEATESIYNSDFLKTKKQNSSSNKT